MRSASPRPAVIASVVGSPRRSSRALVATVVPILIASIALAGIGASGFRCSSCRIPSSAASSYCSGLSDRSLCTRIAPAGVRATTSVKVPPRSIQNCQADARPTSVIAAPVSRLIGKSTHSPTVDQSEALCMRLRRTTLPISRPAV
jgi:hypothetical protein